MNKSAKVEESPGVYKEYVVYDSTKDAGYRAFARYIYNLK